MGANLAKAAKQLDEPRDHLCARVFKQSCSESLAIPTNYVKDVIPKIPSRVPLVVSTDKIWNVGVKEEGENLVVRYGWKEFVEDNSLEENDIMVFRFHNYGQVCFHLTLFDQTGCEKGQSVPEDNIRESQKDNDPMKAREPDSEVEIIDVLKKETPSPIAQNEKEFESNGAMVIGQDPTKVDSPPSRAKSKKITCSNKLSTKKGKKDGLGDDIHEPANKKLKLTTPASKTCTVYVKGVRSTKKRKDSLGDDVHEPAKEKLTTPALKTSATKDKGVQDVHEPSNEQLTTPSSKLSAKRSAGVGTKRKYQRKKLSTSSTYKKPVHRKGMIKQASGVSTPSGSYKLYFKSRRRLITEEERQKAFQSASEVISNKPNFVITLVPTHVEKRFFLTIPRKLVVEHIPSLAKGAILRVPPNPKTWIARLTGKRSTFTGLDGGWADFVFDNNLEVGDACLFELCGVQECGKILIDVSIYRAVEEVVPLEKVRPFDFPKASPSG